MRKLALDDEILLTIEKPARYIGNEVNAVMKDKSEVAVRFAMCFPDVYEIGMSHLGIQILYDMFNQRDDMPEAECPNTMFCFLRCQAYDKKVRWTFFSY